MVDLAKIRKKAKKGGGPAPSPAAEGGGPTPEAKLQHFLADAGTKRPGFVTQTAVETAADQIELLTFTLGGEQYAIDIDRVAEIVTARPVTPVPNTNPLIVGIVSLRGAIVTLFDIRSKLRQPPRSAADDARIIVIHDGASLLGFEVDRVLRPMKVDRAAIEPQPVVHPLEESEAIRGVVRGPNALTIVLDLDKLLT